MILTLPVPQILQLQGSFQVYLDEYRSLLERVEYSSRYALALYYSKDTPIELPWTAKYVDQDTCIRFVCVDSLKRGKGVCIWTFVELVGISFARLAIMLIV